MHQRTVSSGGCVAFTSQSTQVVHAFQNDHVTYTGLRQYIAVESSQCIWTEPICQQVVSADSVIEHTNAARGSSCLKALGQKIRPAIVAVGRRAMTVGDRVAERNDRSRVRAAAHINGRDLIPVID